MDQKIYDMLESNPVIAAVKDTDGLEECVGLEDIKVVFILFGDICSIPGIVQKVRDAGKIAVVHVDLINGLGSREIAVDFIRENTQADGIISTKPALIRRGNELGLFTVHRYFLIDSMALENIKSPQPGIRPDVIEVLPGLMPKVTSLFFCFPASLTVLCSADTSALSFCRRQSARLTFAAMVPSASFS